MKKLIFSCLMLCMTVVAWAQSWENITSDYLVNADLSNGLTGWTQTNFNTPAKQTNSGYATECYAGWGSLDVTSYSLTQKVTLPAGTYKLENSSFFRQGLVYNTNASKSLAFLTAGTNKVAIKTLGSETAKAYADTQAQAAGVLSGGMYNNTLEFTLDAEATIDLGITGTFDLKQSWCLVGAFRLYKSASTTANLDFTNKITNPNFENGLTGWQTVGGWGEQNNGNAAQVGTRYIEQWSNNSSAPQVGNDIYQTVNLPAGTYELSALVHAETLNAELYAGENVVEVKATAEPARKTVEFTLDEAGDIRVGYRVVSSAGSTGNHWAVIDNVLLFCKEAGAFFIIGSPVASTTVVEPGDVITISFPSHETNTTEVFTLDATKVTGAGSVAVEDNTFKVTIPSTWEKGTHTITVGAGAASYGDKASSEATEITLIIPELTSGIYFLRSDAGHYLSRGNTYGTQAITDNWGLPVNIEHAGNNEYTIRYVDTNGYLFHANNWDAYTDGGATGNNRWTFTKLNDGTYRIHNLAKEGYLKQNTKAAEQAVFTDGNTDAQIVNWTLESPADHAVQMAALKTAAKALQADAEAMKNQKVYATSAPTATSEQYQKTGNIINNELRVYPGIYKISMAAFHRLTNNDDTYALHQQGADCPPVYMYFGDAKVQIYSSMDDNITGLTGGWDKDGVTYPNGQGGALSAFQAGKYLNTMYVRVAEAGVITYGLQNQGKAANDNQGNARWTCYATDGIEIVRYYNDEDGIDKGDQIQEDNYFKQGDINKDDNVTISDIAQEINDLLKGKATTNRHKVNGAETVDESDVTTLADIVLEKKTATQVDNLDQFFILNADVAADQSTAAYTIKSAKRFTDGTEIANTSEQLQKAFTRVKITTTLPNIIGASIYAKGKENITGPFSAEYIDETVSSCTTTAGVNTTWGNTESDVVNVTKADAATDFTLYLRPVALNNGVTVTLRTADGKFYTQDFDINAGTENNLTFTTTTTSGAWMATLPGKVHFNGISLPGAHDAATSSCTLNAAKCQSLTIAQQLEVGVRAFDLRPKGTTAAGLTIYHGSSNTNVKFATALQYIVDYLKAHPTETAFATIHDEDSKASTQWQSAVTECLTAQKDYIKVIDGNMTLDDCRGKLVIIARDNIANTNLAGKCGWGSSFNDKTVFYANDSSGQTGWTLVYQDDYNTSSTSTRLSDIEKMQRDYINGNTDKNKIFINTTNMPNSPKSYATTINANILKSTVFTGATGRLGIVSSDYVGDSTTSGDLLLQFIINHNYIYLFK